MDKIGGRLKEKENKRSLVIVQGFVFSEKGLLSNSNISS
jgi:hypothetical protein